jgi:hypothetical protein
MFFVYALHVAFQLQALADRTATVQPDRVLLVGRSHFFDEPGPRSALYSAGWTHLVCVDLIDGAHLSDARRHDDVFTKLRAFSLPYQKVVLLDLDLLVQNNVDCLFDVSAPAAKYHGTRHASLTHGGLLPEEVRKDQNWCPNAGVMRLDPCPTQQERWEMMCTMEHEISDGMGLWKTMLPEQYYLAQRLHCWRQIDSKFNLELYEITSLDQLRRASIVHFSGKSSWDQPTVWLDIELGMLKQFMEDRFEMHTSPEEKFRAQVFGCACHEWRLTFEKLLIDSTRWVEAHLGDDRQDADSCVSRMMRQIRMMSS